MATVDDGEGFFCIHAGLFSVLSRRADRPAAESNSAPLYISRMNQFRCGVWEERCRSHPLGLRVCWPFFVDGYAFHGNKCQASFYWKGGRLDRHALITPLIVYLGPTMTGGQKKDDPRRPEPNIRILGHRLFWPFCWRFQIAV